MGYLFRVRLSSFFAGAAVASGLGFYFLYKDYKIAQEAISQQIPVFAGISKIGSCPVPTPRCIDLLTGGEAVLFAVGPFLPTLAWPGYDTL